MTGAVDGSGVAAGGGVGAGAGGASDWTRLTELACGTPADGVGADVPASESAPVTASSATGDVATVESPVFEGVVDFDGTGVPVDGWDEDVFVPPA